MDDTLARRPLLRNAVKRFAHVHVASSFTITTVTDFSVVLYKMSDDNTRTLWRALIRDGCGAAIRGLWHQYALADAASDSDADVDSDDSHRAVEVKVEDGVAGPDSVSDSDDYIYATPTLYIGLTSDLRHINNFNVCYNMLFVNYLIDPKVKIRIKI